MTDVFFNGKIIGIVSNPEDFVKEVIATRRKEDISNQLNINYNNKIDAIEIVTEKDRVRRPLIVVKDGVSTLTEDHVQRLEEGELTWSELVNQGIIEYLDALEEEGAYVALKEEELTKEHTHLELGSLHIFGLCTAMVPYANFNQSTRLNIGQKIQKQAIGCYALNYLNRMDTAVNLLHYPQRPLVKSFAQGIFGEELSSGQNIVIAILNYEGYNMEDAIVINRAAIDKGFGRSTYYRPYRTEKLRYFGGQVDEIGIPDKEVQGYSVERDYRYLTDDGIIYPEAVVSGGDVLIGKTSPPRFLGKLEAFSTVANIRKDTSIRQKFGEKGVVSTAAITESADGSMLIKIEVRDTRTPEIGDKFSSRHGQKGIVGFIVPPEDVPFTSNGVTPDLIFSPNGLPKRMTVAQLFEILGGKVAALAGRNIDGTPFESESYEDLKKQLLDLGFREDGLEVLYDGKTGKEFPARIFIGDMYYMRLKYQVADKIQSRSRGPVALLTRQPTEGKAREGGLRLGEMEKECLVAHGAALLMKERFDSDKTIIWICERCGNVAVYDSYKNKAYCLCGEKTKISPIEISYAFKLFLDELKSMHIRTKLLLKDKY